MACRRRAHAFILYSKTKSSLCRLSGSHFFENQPLLAHQAEQLFSTTAAITERMRELGDYQLRPFAHNDLLRDLRDDMAAFTDPDDVLAELRRDNQIFTGILRFAQRLCVGCADLVTASLLDVWIDDARRRAWILFEVTGKD